MLIEITQFAGTDMKLIKHVGPYAMNPKVVTEMDGYPILTSDKFVWFCAFSGSKIIGFCALKYTKQYCHFTYDYVQPEYRGKGVYKKLFKERMKWARLQIKTEIDADCTELSIQLFLKNGFTVVKKMNKWTKVKLEK